MVSDDDHNIDDYNNDDDDDVPLINLCNFNNLLANLPNGQGLGKGKGMQVSMDEGKPNATGKAAKKAAGKTKKRGVDVLHEIRTLQSTTDLLLRKRPF